MLKIIQGIQKKIKTNGIHLVFNKLKFKRKVNRIVESEIKEEFLNNKKVIKCVAKFCQISQHTFRGD